MGEQTKTLLALGRANLRYWRGVATPVRRQLAQWRSAAERIPDPRLRSMALQKLIEERFNVQLAASMAARAPRAWRATTVRALVALQILYDYLDLLGESTPEDVSPHYAFLDAVHTRCASDSHYLERPDGPYLKRLVDTVNCALEWLPARDAVDETLRSEAELCAEAQACWHSGDPSAMGKPRRRGSRGASASTMDVALAWPETVAAASASVLTLHALIVAAADEQTTGVYARQLADAYSFVCALTMLDSALDESIDCVRGQLNYVQLCGGREALAERLALLAGEALSRLNELHDAADHRVTLIGIVAYYCSAGNSDHDMRPFEKRLRAQLGTSVAFALAILKAWRLGKRLSRRSPRTQTSDPMPSARLAA